MRSINREHDIARLRDVPRSSRMIAFPVYPEQVSKFVRCRRFPPLNTFARILDRAHCCYRNGIRSTVQSHRADRNGMARQKCSECIKLITRTKWATFRRNISYHISYANDRIIRCAYSWQWISEYYERILKNFSRASSSRRTWCEIRRDWLNSNGIFL